MAASGSTPIQLYRTSTAAATPTAGNLADGELAINTTDEKLYFKNAAGTVKLLASTAGASGDVVGPASATDNAPVAFDGTTGKLIKQVTVTGTGSVVLANSPTLVTPVLGVATGTSFQGIIGNVAPAAGTFTSLTSSSGASIQNLTVGLGASAINTNTAIGNNSLAAITTGSSNTAVGWHSSQSMVQGSANTALGLSSLRDTLNGYDNTAIGSQSLQNNTQGFANVAVGSLALTSNLTGYGNVAVGYTALRESTGNDNTALGTNALFDSTGNFNIAIGSSAGYSITSGSNNVVIGSYTGNAAPISQTGNNWIVLSDGAGNVRQAIDPTGNAQFLTGAVVVDAPAPTAIAAAATLTNANIQNQLIVTTGTTYTIRMPVGTTLESLISWAGVDLGYDFSIINTASGTITLDATETGVTGVGTMTVLTGISARFRIRRTAANTFIVYRI